MKLLSLGLVLIAGGSSACGAAQPVAVRTVSQRAVATPGDLVFATVSCVLSGDATARTCALAADRAGVDATRVAAADPSALEQVGEALGRAAHQARVPVADRAAFQGWFDLASTAAKEAHTARGGARCEAAVACEARNGGHPALDDVEEAWRHDRAAARAHGALVRLFTWLPDAGSMQADAEATALLILADRIEAAAQARPEVREEAAQAIDGTFMELAAIGSPVADGPGAPVHVESTHGVTAVAAHAGGNALHPSLSDAHARVVARMREVSTHVEAPTLRAVLDPPSSGSARTP